MVLAQRLVRLVDFVGLGTVGSFGGLGWVGQTLQGDHGASSALGDKGIGLPDPVDSVRDDVCRCLHQLADGLGWSDFSRMARDYVHCFKWMRCSASRGSRRKD